MRKKDKEVDKILAKFKAKKDIPQIKTELLALLQEVQQPVEGEKIVALGRGINFKKPRA